jgi:hypothetical protein
LRRVNNVRPHDERCGREEVGVEREGGRKGTLMEEAVHRRRWMVTETARRSCGGK